MLQGLTDAFVERFKQTDVFRSMVRQEATETREARQPLIERRAACLRDLPIARARHDKAIAPLEAAAKKSREKAEADQRALMAAHQAKRLEVSGLIHTIDSLELKLASTADRKIDAAKSAMNVRFHEKRGGIGTHQEQLTGRITGQGSKMLETRIVNNQGAVRRLHEAMREARAALDALKLTNPDDLDAAIAAILVPVREAWDAVGDLDPVTEDGPKAA